MRDGDVMGQLPTVEHIVKYDSEISDSLISCMIDFLFVPESPFSRLMYPGWVK
jgi:hypothetical protein